ncbi:MAG: replicative DNA helicase [Acidobacteria bacterium]|nr:replicative DNA helicase [Acidobacteriota bacterium]
MTRSSPSDPFFEKGLPSNLEAERSILGAILLDNSVCNQAMELMRRDDFFLDSHRRIYDKMILLSERGSSIDLVTLSEELRRAMEFEQIGGATYIASLIDGVPRTDTIEPYVKIVKSKAILRKLITASNQIIARAFDEEDDPDVILDQAEQLIFQIAEDRVRAGFQHIGDVAQRRLEQIEQMSGRTEMITGVPTGFTDFDQMTSGLQRQDLIIIAARPSMGKAQPLDAKVLTENGWKTMGEVQVGDDLASIDGRPSTVIGVFPQGIKQIYRVTFSDGRSTECCGEHLWRVYYRHWPEPKILTTDEVAALLKCKRYQKRLWIDLCSGDFGHHDPLPIDPWVLGLLIGEGDFHALRFSTASATVLQQMAVGLGAEFALSAAGNYDYRIMQAAGHRRAERFGVWPNPVCEQLKALGLWGKRSEEKFIPELYKHANRQSRLALLQGLLDADGWAERHGSVRFSTASERLADDVVELARSLGAWATKKSKQTAFTYKGEAKPGRPAFVINIAHPQPDSLFTLPEKRARVAADRKRRKMPTFVSIEPVRQTEARCLAVTHPTQLYITDDYVVTHNTALALNMALYAAKNGNSVGVFSLEMSAEQLVSRLLCSEARVDAHRLRTGYLNQEEWARLADALRRLCETKVFIDDTPGASVLEMRAKTRRLKAEHGLDLLIIDYLQLMSGRGRIESRQQEVSQISRDLKILAKELDVPVISLSQLSRATETRSDHKPQLSDLRESGCLAGDSLVTLADSGAEVPIRNLVGQSGFAVWALNEVTMQLEWAMVSNAFSTGVKPVYKMTTRLGREIRATANHKFLTFAGWKRLDELHIGERLAVPRRVPSPATQTMTDAELALLGHLIGDGCTLPRHAIQYTTREKDLADLVASLAVEVFGSQVVPRIKQERTWYQVYLSSARHHTHNVRSAVTEWLDELGVFGLRSHEKRVPKKVFEQPQEAIALFLRHLWATDGCIRFKTAGKKHLPYPAIYYASSSKELAANVQSLLLRIGINARLRRVPQGTKGRDQYHVIVGGKGDFEKFAEKIKAVGIYKMTSLEEVQCSIKNSVANTNIDTIPNSIWRQYVFPAMQERGITSRQMMQRINTAYRGTRVYDQNVSRDRAARIAEAIGSSQLMKLAESDVYWDEIVSIGIDGEEAVYDLTVEKEHNFISCNIYAHNSIEQDADVVCFIYRDEVYNPTDENRGTAELIVGKQRNGPTGSVALAFLKEFTRFENMYRGE